MTKNIILISCDWKYYRDVIDDKYDISPNNNRLCLGHEIHMSRILLIDMLIQNKISTQDTIVTLNDRIFLYKNIFHSCITYQEYKKMNIQEYNIINLIYITGTIFPVQANNILNFYGHKTLDKFYTPITKQLLNNIDYCNIDMFDNKDYIIIHHRYDCDINILFKILSKINETRVNIHIVIFNNNLEDLKKQTTIKQYTNLFFIDNLQVYASYLNHPKCKLLISEFSGGGQLSHYCYDGIVMYYFYTYNDYSHIGNETKFLNASMETDMFQYWDFKNTRNIKILFFYNSDNLLENL